MNTTFRNEGAGLSSELIREAVAATRAIWGPPPALGFVSFVDARKVRSTNPGYCYQMAGWDRATCPKHAEVTPGCAACEGLTTKHRLLAYQLPADRIPAGDYAIGSTMPLFGMR